MIVISDKPYKKKVQSVGKNEKIQAFYRLNAARPEIRRYLPDDFDPARELEEARNEHYGCVS